MVEELQHCLALISSQPEAAAGSMEVLHKLLNNLITAPQVRKAIESQLEHPLLLKHLGSWDMLQH